MNSKIWQRCRYYIKQYKSVGAMLEAEASKRQSDTSYISVMPADALMFYIYIYIKDDKVNLKEIMNHRTNVLELSG